MGALSISHANRGLDTTSFFEASAVPHGQHPGTVEPLHVRDGVDLPGVSALALTSPNEPPPRTGRPGEWIDIHKGEDDPFGNRGGGGGVGTAVAIGTIVGTAWLVGWVRKKFTGGGGSGPQPAPPPAPNNANGSRGPKPPPTYPVATAHPPFTPNQREEIARLTHRAEELYDLYERALKAGSPEADAFYGDAARAGQDLVKRVVQLMGLPEAYASRIQFDPTFGGPGRTKLEENVAQVGWGGVTANGEAVVAIIAHEAAHLYQRDRDNLNPAKFDGNRAAYESEATRLAEEYLRTLGYDEATIRALRRYAVE